MRAIRGEPRLAFGLCPLLLALMLTGCQTTRYLPPELEGTALDQLAYIERNKSGIVTTPNFMLSSVDGIRLAGSFSGGSPAVYLGPGEHRFVIKRKYHKRPYYNKGARVGSSVVTSPGYGMFATPHWEKREGILQLDLGKQYSVEQLFKMLPKARK